MFNKIDLNHEFTSKLFFLAIPIFIQSLTMSVLSFVDVIMVGQLGDSIVAGVGIANQINYIRIILSFGIACGVGVFSAQYWGARDISNLHRFQGIGLVLSLTVGVIFLVFSVFFPHMLISFYTNDPEVIQISSNYFGILGISFLFTSITIVYSQVMRGTEHVKIPLIASSTAFGLNTALNYLLIFGKFGFPQLGYKGAAIATVISRVVEVGILLIVAYIKKLPSASSIKQLINWDLSSILKFLKISSPIIIHNGLWIIGISIYAMVYGKVSTEALAAFHICKSFENISNMVFSSFGNTGGIMLGNRLGAKEFDKARTYAYNFFFIEFLMAILFAAIFILGRPVFILIYKLSDTGTFYLSVMLIVFGIYTLPKAGNVLLNMGILRSGGDTRFAMFLDVGTVWLYGVPVVFIGAFILKLPVYYVVAMVSMEEVIKFSIGYIRFKKGKWVRNLTE